MVTARMCALLWSVPTRFSKRASPPLIRFSSFIRVRLPMINGRTYLMPGFACGTTLKRIGAVLGMLQSGELLPQRYNGCRTTGSRRHEGYEITPVADASGRPDAFTKQTEVRSTEPLLSCAKEKRPQRPMHLHAAVVIDEASSPKFIH